MRRSGTKRAARFFLGCQFSRRRRDVGAPHVRSGHDVVARRHRIVVHAFGASSRAARARVFVRRVAIRLDAAFAFTSHNHG